MQTADHKEKSWKSKWLRWLGLTDAVTIKLYHGYGHQEQLSLFGHVLQLGPLPRHRYGRGVLHNSFSLLRLFLVRPFPHVTVRLQWNNEVYTCSTDTDGFFRFDWKTGQTQTPGWHTVPVEVLVGQKVVSQATGELFIPYPTQYGFISDIDDTFLISHSANLRKRLWVLFTQDARSRQPFEGSVKHYQMLALGNTTPDAPNPFFFVSSSEWNLYDYIAEFARVHEIPRGVYLLNQLKRFHQLLKTGQNHHQTKFTRIARILEAYPSQRFVLLGDSSQQDPYIYQALVKHFPKQIHAVYIRNVYAPHQQKVEETLVQIESKGVPCCFFRHSSEAILHSRKIGLISTEDVAKEGAAMPPSLNK